MRKAEWTSEDGKFKITVKVYPSRRLLKRAIVRAEQNGPDASGIAFSYRYENLNPEATLKRRVESFILLEQDYCTPGIFAHEANHIAHQLARWFPVRGQDAEETRCAYLDTIIDLFTPWLKKRKLFVKRHNNWHQGLMWK